MIGFIIIKISRKVIKMKDEDGFFYTDEYGHKCRSREDEIDPDADSDR